MLYPSLCIDLILSSTPLLMDTYGVSYYYTQCYDEHSYVCLFGVRGLPLTCSGRPQMRVGRRVLKPMSWDLKSMISNQFSCIPHPFSSMPHTASHSGHSPKPDPRNGLSTLLGALLSPWSSPFTSLSLCFPSCTMCGGK